MALNLLSKIIIDEYKKFLLKHRYIFIIKEVISHTVTIVAESFQKDYNRSHFICNTFERIL
jgi:hypothetical protein